MTLEQLGNIGEAIGGLAVIISLLVLAFQVRQNTRAVRMESARASESAWSNLDLRIATEFPPDLGLKIHTAQGIDELSPEELLRVQVVLRAIWHQLSSEYYLYRDGKLEEGIWERRVRWFHGYVSLPVVGYFFKEDLRLFLDPDLYDQVTQAVPVSDVNPSGLD